MIWRDASVSFVEVSTLLEILAEGYVKAVANTKWGFVSTLLEILARIFVTEMKTVYVFDVSTLLEILADVSSGGNGPKRFQPFLRFWVAHRVR